MLRVLLVKIKPRLQSDMDKRNLCVFRTGPRSDSRSDCKKEEEDILHERA